MGTLPNIFFSIHLFRTRKQDIFDTETNKKRKNWKRYAGINSNPNPRLEVDF